MPASPRIAATRYIRVTERAYALLRLHRRANETLSEVVERLGAQARSPAEGRWTVHGARADDDAATIPLPM